jgi:hypothetical protein
MAGKGGQLMRTKEKNRGSLKRAIHEWVWVGRGLVRVRAAARCLPACLILRFKFE